VAGRLFIGGSFKTVDAVTRTALAAVDPVTGALSADLNLPVAVTGGATTRYQQQCAACSPPPCVTSTSRPTAATSWS
jgi:hypothetical protein